MAIGARKAFEELPNEADRERWLELPFTGCDGLPKTGQAWVRSACWLPQFLFRLMLIKLSKCSRKRFSRRSVRPSACLARLPRFLLLVP